jgi:hypothetical protein
MSNENAAAPSRGQSPKSAALEYLPQEWRERLIAEATDMGIRSDDDTGWLLVGAFINSWACAAAAGRSAQAVDNGVKSIPDLIYRGAELAGDDVKKIIDLKAVEAGNSISEKVAQAGSKIRENILGIFTENIASMRSAADSAASKAQQARDSIIQSGVQEYRQLAAQAIEQQMAGYRIEKRRNAFLVGAFTIAFSSAFTAYGILSAIESLHYVAPEPISVTKSGHRNCGVANVQGIGQQYVCVLDARIPPPPKIPQQ